MPAGCAPRSLSRIADPSWRRGGLSAPLFRTPRPPAFEAVRSEFLRNITTGRRFDSGPPDSSGGSSAVGRRRGDASSPVTSVSFLLESLCGSKDGLTSLLHGLPVRTRRLASACLAQLG